MKTHIEYTDDLLQATNDLLILSKQHQNLLLQTKKQSIHKKRVLVSLILLAIVMNFVVAGAVGFDFVNILSFIGLSILMVFSAYVWWLFNVTQVFERARMNELERLRETEIQSKGLLLQTELHQQAQQKQRFAQSGTCVYFVKNQQGAVKIGITSDLKNRVASLQTSSAEALALCFAISTEQAAALESQLHERFKNKRIKNEWFGLTQSDIESVQREYGAWML